MENDYVISRAVADLPTAEAVLGVEQHSLGDSAYSAQEILAVMQRPEHVVHVARFGGAVVGFCSAFVTHSRGGPQLELDMLGVLPEHRGRGLGTRLLQASICDGQRAGIGRFRGVVSLDNIASQRAFARAGLSPLKVVRHMLIYTIRGSVPVALQNGARWEALDRGIFASPAGDRPALSGRDTSQRAIRVLSGQQRMIALAECQFVHTLSYGGVWVEHAEAGTSSAQSALARAVVEWAKTTDADEVGYLMPVDERQTGRDPRLPWLSQGYEDAGGYRIYVGGAESAVWRASSV